MRAVEKGDWGSEQQPWRGAKKDQWSAEVVRTQGRKKENGANLNGPCSNRARRGLGEQHETTEHDARLVNKKPFLKAT